MSGDRDLLAAACLQLAQTLLNQQKPFDIQRFSSLEEALRSEADQVLDNFKDGYATRWKELDPETVVARAVFYIDSVHAIPPIGANIEWFRYTLEALVEVAMPNTVPSGKATGFVTDMLVGVGTTLENI